MSAAPSPLSGVPVLVTGAAGFIGSHLARRLVREGARVHAWDLAAAAPPRLADVRDALRWRAVDLDDPAATQAAFAAAAPRVVFHLAARVDVARGFATQDAAVRDLDAALRLARLAAGAGAARFVFAGTCEEYGDGPAPFREDQPPAPVSPYSAAKAAVTLFLRMYHRTAGFPAVVLRPFLAYGPGQPPSRFLSQVMEAARSGSALPMTKGEQTREFTYVTDVAEAFAVAATHPAAVGEVFNVDRGEDYALRDVVGLVARVTGLPVRAGFGAIPYRPGETMRFVGDPSKARERLGWKARIGLEEGVRRTWEWYRGERAEAEA